MDTRRQTQGLLKAGGGATFQSSPLLGAGHLTELGKANSASKRGPDIPKKKKKNPKYRVFFLRERKRLLIILGLFHIPFNLRLFHSISSFPAS